MRAIISAVYVSDESPKAPRSGPFFRGKIQHSDLSELRLYLIEHRDIELSLV
jgi:hypothetical protein